MASWIIKRDRLDPDQRRIIDAPINNNMWIAGFAGSGKSVVLVHKAISIVEKNPDAKITFVVYTRSLVDLFKTGLITLGHPDIEVSTIYEFMEKNINSYEYVFCDEIQDFTISMIRAIKNKSTKNVVVAGDKFQSIYDIDVRYREQTINPQEVLPNLLNTRNEELRKIYRLTPSIINAIDKFLPSMRLAINGYPNAQKADVSILLCKRPNRSEESVYTYNRAEKYISQNERTAVLFSKHDYCIEFANHVLSAKGKPCWTTQLNRYNKPDYSSLNTHLTNNGIKLMYIGNGYGSLKYAEEKSIGVMMTYQSSKGLDFEHVYIPYANNDLFISANNDRSRTIFMVAMSRSSKNLTFTYSNQLHEYISAFRNLCTEINIDTTNNSTTDFDF